MKDCLKVRVITATEMTEDNNEACSRFIDLWDRTKVLQCDLIAPPLDQYVSEENVKSLDADENICLLPLS